MITLDITEEIVDGKKILTPILSLDTSKEINLSYLTQMIYMLQSGMFASYLYNDISQILSPEQLNKVNTLLGTLFLLSASKEINQIDNESILDASKNPMIGPEQTPKIIEPNEEE